MTDLIRVGFFFQGKSKPVGAEANPVSSQTSPSPSTVEKADFVCYRCKKPGHRFLSGNLSGEGGVTPLCSPCGPPAVPVVATRLQVAGLQYGDQLGVIGLTWRRCRHINPHPPLSRSLSLSLAFSTFF